jgi:hypothetical protein
MSEVDDDGMVKGRRLRLTGQIACTQKILSVKIPLLCADAFYTIA